MSGRCRSHLYSRAMQAGSRGACVRCGAEEPLRGIISGPEPRVEETVTITYLAGEKRIDFDGAYRRAVKAMIAGHPVEDAFDPGPEPEPTPALKALMRPLAEALCPWPIEGVRAAIRKEYGVPVSDYAPQMAREFYDHDDCA